jgi:hypothetical protein
VIVWKSTSKWGKKVSKKSIRWVSIKAKAASKKIESGAKTVEKKGKEAWKATTKWGKKVSKKSSRWLSTEAKAARK